MEEFSTSQSRGVHPSNGALLRAICWRLQRLTSQATCSLYAVAGRWELRLEIDGHLEACQVFGNREDWIRLSIQWKTSFCEHGWCEHVDHPQVRLVPVA
jgi:hypothetical protein